MKLVGTVATAITLAGASLGLAGPALADSLEGTYTAEVIGVDGSASPLTNSPWVLTPCGPDCVSGGGREFHLQGNTWTSITAAPDGMPCPTTFDNASLTGKTGCGGMEFPLKLTKVG